MPFQSVRKVFQRKENPHFIKSFSFFLQEILSVIYHRIWQFLLKFHHNIPHSCISFSLPSFFLLRYPEVHRSEVLRHALPSYIPVFPLFLNHNNAFSYIHVPDTFLLYHASDKLSEIFHILFFLYMNRKIFQKLSLFICQKNRICVSIRINLNGIRKAFLKRSNILFWHTAMRNAVRSLFSYASNNAAGELLCGKILCHKLISGSMAHKKFFSVACMPPGLQESCQITSRLFLLLGKWLPYLSFLYYKSYDYFLSDYIIGLSWLLVNYIIHIVIISI